MKEFKKGDRVRIIKDFKPGLPNYKGRDGRQAIFLRYLTSADFSPYEAGYKYRVEFTYDSKDINVWDIELVEEKKLPEKWCIRITEQNREIVSEWFMENHKEDTKYSGFSTGFYYHSPAYKHNNCADESVKDGYTEITLEQFIKHTNMKKIKEYELIKTYPGYKLLGERVPYTTGEYSNYPEYWKPIYEEDKIEIKGYEAVVVSSSLSSDKLIKFGCQSFNKNELLAYKRLYTTNLLGDITIHGEKISEDIIDKLIAKL